MKKILGIFMILGITYCSVAEKQDEQDETLQEAGLQQAPCDSFEQKQYDQHGNEYIVKVPCDTAKQVKGVAGDTVIRIH